MSNSNNINKNMNSQAAATAAESAGTGTGRSSSKHNKHGIQLFLRHHVPQGLASLRNSHININNKQNPPQQQRHQYKLYVGNEAADADSIVSALCYAYLQYLVSNGAAAAATTTTTTTTTTTVFHLPIVSIPRSELHLRRDVQLLLQDKKEDKEEEDKDKGGIAVELTDLVCVDEISMGDSSTTTAAGIEDVEITLLDHNALAPVVKEALISGSCSSSSADTDASEATKPQQQLLESRVVAILDHHLDGHQHTHVAAGARNIAFDAASSTALVGSACTLVAEELVKYVDVVCGAGATTAGAAAEGVAIADLAVLLKAVIALDTLNMDARAKKGTNRDAIMLQQLDVYSPAPQYAATDALFNKLVNAKTDIAFWRQLSTAECLRLDAKTFTGIRNKSNSNNSNSNININSSSKTSSKNKNNKKTFSIAISSVLLPAAELLHSKADAESVIRNVLYTTTTAATHTLPSAAPSSASSASAAAKAEAACDFSSASASASQAEVAAANTAAATAIAAASAAASYSYSSSYAATDTDVLVVMSMVRQPDTGTVERELLLAGRDKQLLGRIGEYLMTKSDLDVSLLHSKTFAAAAAAAASSAASSDSSSTTRTATTGDKAAAAAAAAGEFHMSVYTQGNVGRSRKQVAPLLQTFFSNDDE
jgi:inorganic pyrophosphatase/exopolyphosphatase